MVLWAKSMERVEEVGLDHGGGALGVWDLRGAQVMEGVRDASVGTWAARVGALNALSSEAFTGAPGERLSLH
jgi:hypothetical protein